MCSLGVIHTGCREGGIVPISRDPQSNSKTDLLEPSPSSESIEVELRVNGGPLVRLEECIGHEQDRALVPRDRISREVKIEATADRLSLPARFNQGSKDLLSSTALGCGSRPPDILFETRRRCVFR